MQQAEAGEDSSSVHTVNAAAVVLAAAARSSTGLRPHHHHLQLHDHAPAAATKKRWWSRLSATLCFRPHGHGHPRRVIAAAYADTPPRPAAAAAHTASAYVHQAPPAHPVFAFAAPPSSPASSLFQSEAPSPVLLDLHGTAGSSPSMFSVGPYARGPQQLVSPPVLYSALTTEPSTAPRTPPATTGPSSPEVPFARFVDDGHELLFHHAAYQLRQGSPVIPLVSPEPEPGSPSSSSPTPQLLRFPVPRAATAMLRPSPLLPGPGASAAAPGRATSMRMFHGDVFLGEAEVFSIKPGPEGALPFPSNEIRISHLSPASERCPPLAILQTIAPFSVRCKLQAKPLSPHPSLHRLYLTCFNEYKSAVVVVGDEELHLVAMPSKVEKVPCFWCCSVRTGLYAASVGMLNLRCLAIVFDLDETLIVANTMRSFESRIEMLSRRMDIEDDPVRVAGMSAEIKRYIEDRELLKEFIDTDTVTDNGRIVGTQKEEVQPMPGVQERLVRPVIRLPERNAILTRINPEIRDTSVFVKLRPAWEDLRSYLTAKGRKRFEVYVCTMAERDYALEIWRLLDPEANLISLNNLSDRVVCVKAGSKKSLQHVFRDGGCHPKMAMVIDDRLQVWDEKDQHRVHVVPAYAPYYAPQAEMANAVPVLCVARNVACNVRGGFFREFDENLLKKVFELLYENELLDLPYAPDVGDYLVCEDPNFPPSNKDPAPIPEGMSGAEVEKRLNGRAYQGDQKQISSTRPSDDARVAIRGTLGSSNVQPNGGSMAIVPSLFVTVLQEIGRLCNSKVEFRSTVSTSKITQFSVEVLFSNEKIGNGIGKTRDEAQVQAAEKALQNLQSNYLSFVAPIAGVLNKDTSKSSRNGNGFLEDDLDSDGDTAMQEPSGSTSEQKDHSNVDRFSSVISLIRELCLEDQHVVFRDQVRNPGSATNEEYHFQVELAGQILGNGIGVNKDFAKLQAAEEALRFLKTTTDPQIKKHLRPIRCSS